MHDFGACSKVLCCTETVHGTAAGHALKPCKVRGGCDLHHARVGVQHNGPTPCTTAVQHTLHGCGATQDNPYRTTNPVMHYVQDGCNPLPDFMTTPETNSATYATNRPHTRRGSIVMRKRRCPHSNLDGIYGDRINAVGGWRLQCLDCRRYLDGPVVLAEIRRNELEARNR